MRGDQGKNPGRGSLPGEKYWDTKRKIRTKLTLKEEKIGYN